MENIMNTLKNGTQAEKKKVRARGGGAMCGLLLTVFQAIMEAIEMEQNINSRLYGHPRKMDADFHRCEGIGSGSEPLNGRRH